MTTIIGVKTNAGLEKIVIGSDTQECSLDSDGSLIEKKVISKVLCGERWALGHAGLTSDLNLYRFYQILQGNKRYGSSLDKATELIVKAVQNFRECRGKELRFELGFRGPDFMEVCYLNSLLKRAKPEEDGTHNFILGTSLPDGKLGLWVVDEFGNLQLPEKKEEFNYACIGTGSDIVDSYIEEAIYDNQFDSNNIDTPHAIDLVVKSLEKAQKDVNTGFPIELAVIDSSKTAIYGKSITDAISKAFTKRIEEIKQEHNQQETYT